MKNQSKEIQDIENALRKFSEKHKGDVVITVSVCGFDHDNNVIDDHIWLQGDIECMKVSLESMIDELKD